MSFHTLLLSHSKKISSLLIIIFFSACATYKPQSNISETSTEDDAVYTFYIAGGIGDIDDKSNPEVQNLLKSYLKKANKKSTLLFTGDYIRA